MMRGALSVSMVMTFSSAESAENWRMEAQAIAGFAFTDK